MLTIGLMAAAHSVVAGTLTRNLPFLAVLIEYMLSGPFGCARSVPMGFRPERLTLNSVTVRLSSQLSSPLETWPKKPPTWASIVTAVSVAALDVAGATRPAVSAIAARAATPTRRMAERLAVISGVFLLVIDVTPFCCLGDAFSRLVQ